MMMAMVSKCFYTMDNFFSMSQGNKYIRFENFSENVTLTHSDPSVVNLNWKSSSFKHVLFYLHGSDNICRSSFSVNEYETMRKPLDDTLTSWNKGHIR